MGSVHVELLLQDIFNLCISVSMDNLMEYKDFWYIWNEALSIMTTAVWKKLSAFYIFSQK